MSFWAGNCVYNLAKLFGRQLCLSERIINIMKEVVIECILFQQSDN